MARLSDLVRRELAIDPQVTGVTADSRKVQPGYLFAALPGAKADGAAFAAQAVAAGAVAVLSAEPLTGLDVPVVTSADPRRAYALAAAAFWGAQPPVVVAVTGTNGKTSVATFCRQIFASAGRKAASMGTLGVLATGPGLNEQLTPSGLTTPDAADVAELMSRLAGLGVTHLALEASSHGVHQRRLDGVALTAAGFLNLTQDHLDYHGDMASYQAAKLRLFETLLPRGAIQAGQAILSVGEGGQSLRLDRRELQPDGQRLSLIHDGRTFDLRLPLAGAFQAANALVAAGLCLAAGESIETVLAALERLEGAPGRLQRVGAGPRGGEAYVDYAHTPDGLETVLRALRPHTRGRLIVVFGAGGDRDAAKRPLMGKAAADLADIAIVTDDNPRSEDPAAIRAQVRKGAPDAQDIGDRREAIAAAVALLRDGDILVVAGKGHEDYQIIGDVVHPFDDVAVTAQALGAVHV